MKTLTTRFALIAALLLTACGGGGNSVTSSGGDVPPALTNVGTLTATVELQDGVKFIEDTTVAALTSVTADDAGWSLTYRGKPDVAAGDLIVVDGGAFKVRQVTSVDGGTVVLADLPSTGDLFKSVEISGKISLNDRDLQALLDPTRPAQSERKRPLASTSWTPPPFVINEGALSGTTVAAGITKVDFEPNFAFKEGSALIDQANVRLAIDAFLDARLAAQVKPLVKLEADKTLGQACMDIPVKFVGLAGPAVQKFLKPEFCFELKLFAGASDFVDESTASIGGRLAIADQGLIGFSDTTGMILDFPNLVPSLVDVSGPSLVFAKPPAGCTYHSGKIFAGVEMVPSLRVFKVIDLVKLTHKRFLQSELRYLNNRSSVATGYKISSYGQVQTTLGAPAQPLTFKVPYVNKIVSIDLDLGLFKFAETDYNEVDLASSKPLSPCLAISAPVIAPTGVGVKLTPDTASVPAGTRIEYRSSNPGAKVDPAGGITLPGPGKFDVDIITTAADGQQTIDTRPISVNVAGLYNGTFSGNDFGTFTMRLDANGTATGTAYSQRDNVNISVSGSFQPDGSLAFLAGSASGGAQFSGQITPGAGVWVMSGTWANARSGQSGVFSGTGGP